MQLDKSIPIPSDTRKRYQFELWPVGDSLFCSTLEQIDSVQSSARAWAKKKGNGAVFTRRTVEGGYRLWRVA